MGHYGKYQPEWLLSKVDESIDKVIDRFIEATQEDFSGSSYARNRANRSLMRAEERLGESLALAEEAAWDWLHEGLHFHESTVVKLGELGVTPAKHNVFQPYKTGDQ